MSEKIAVIGLGYVGLPLAIALSSRFKVTGFDINVARIAELKEGYDRTAEVKNTIIQQSTIEFSDDPQALQGHSIFIITVPTPVDKNNRPDFSALLEASATVGKAMSSEAIVVFESTVYPGATEDICGPALEKASNLVCGVDFYLGYSPERINPGDQHHTIDKITKVVAGQTPEVTKKLAEIYGALNNNNIFIATNIKTAEAAKVIENTQRDINIAFMNEITMIFSKLGISIYEVLEAANSKWNFLPFSPGLVGGHCIGVDPYYLAECAKKYGQNPEIILAGRRINDGMSDFIAGQINKQLHTVLSYGTPAEILILGLTFKENIPDLRNSKVVDLIRHLQSYGHNITVHDPLADVDESQMIYGISLINSWNEMTGHTNKIQSPGANAHYDCVIGAVAHDAYKGFTPETFFQLLKPKGIVVDIKKCGSLKIGPLIFTIGLYEINESIVSASSCCYWMRSLGTEFNSEFL